MRIALAAVLLLTAAPAFAQDEMIKLKPAQFGELFCIGRIGNDMEAITGIFSTSLLTWKANAEEASAAWEEANPGDKPPLGDGVPWQSFPDYAAECSVGDITVDSDTTAEVEIRYGFPEEPSANFTDTLLLTSYALDDLGNDVWRVDNIRYADGADLLAQLKSIIDGND